MRVLPDHIGLLNAIATGARRGAELLDAWRTATPDPVLARALQQAVIVGHEHAAAFTKRLRELGYPVATSHREDFATELAFAQSAATDGAKFGRLLGPSGEPPASDPLAGLLDDPSIDPQTGELLGRFIAETRASSRALARCG